VQISAGAQDYIRQFKLAAVYVTPSGIVRATTDPARLSGAAVAWWCRSAADAHKLKNAAQASGDIIGTAIELSIALTPHDRVVDRAVERTVAIERALQKAQDIGLLKFFNGKYKRRRQAARAGGKGFMSFTAAQRRLRAAVAGAIARGGELDRSLVASVFGSARL
jgi:hypothetical protein